MTYEITPRRLIRPRDVDQLAKLIVGIAPGQVGDQEPTSEERDDSKTKAGAHRSRRVRGGVKGSLKKETPE